MSADIRGFRYPLEPMLRRQRWELEAVQARLGRLQQEIADARQALEQLRSELALAAARAAQASGARVDPVLQVRTVQWLVGLRHGIGRAEQALELLRERRRALGDEYASRCNKLAVVEEHRGRCVADYLLEQDRRVAALADADWLARLSATSFEDRETA